MRNTIIACVAVVFLAVLGIVSLLPRNEEIQKPFIGKRYVHRSEVKSVLNIAQSDWLPSSEYAGKDVYFGRNKFVSGKGYSLQSIGIEQYQDIWNYVNGGWFEWESADGNTYSVRMNDGVVNAYRVGSTFKPVEMLYDTTYGITRLLELFVFSGVMNTEIMPFVDGVKRRVMYFSEETNPIDYYLNKDKIIASKPKVLEPIKEPALLDRTVADVKIIATPIHYGLKIGDTAPLFNIELLDGRKLNISDYYGRKTVVNMWATWCGQCILEFPIINEAYLQNKGVNILAVCADGSTKQIQRIKDKYSVRYPCEFEMASSIGIDKTYGLKGFPTTYFLDECGIIRHVKIGAFYSEQEVEDILNSY